LSGQSQSVFWRNNDGRLKSGLPDGTHICIPKIPIWVYFGRPLNEKCWYILWQFAIVYGNVYLACLFGIFCCQSVYFSRFGMFYQGKSGNHASIEAITHRQPFFRAVVI
jgi:hypothetical protein